MQQSAAPSEIVVIKPSSLGDIVHTLPAVALLERHWPETCIRWVINTEWAPLLEGNPHVDEVILFPRREFRGLSGCLKIAPWARSLRERINADLVLDFQGLLRSAMISKLCCGKEGRIVGLSDAREGSRLFYNASGDVTGKLHAVDRYLALVAALGVERNPAVPLSWPLPGGTAPATPLPERFVLLHPFSRGEGKSLSANDIRTFCRLLSPLPVVIAGKAEQTVPIAENIVDFVNRTTLAELIFTIRRAAFVVSVDSGPMHIAAALTPQLLSIHTWSDPAKVGPYRPEAWIWKDGNIFRAKDPATRETAPELSAVGAFVRRQLD